MHLEPLILAGFLKLTFREVVFLMPLWQVGAWVLQCGQLVSRRGSWKVTVLAIFLMPLYGEGRYNYIVYPGSGCQVGDFEGNYP